MVYLDRRTEEHVLFIKTREHENMFLFIKTREHENKRKGEGLIEQKENMRFGWALPNTRCLRILT